MIINDGSSDDSIEICKKNKVDYIIDNKLNIGLGKTFQKGLNFFRKSNYDILVNTDADNQYNSNNIKFS